MENLTSLVKQKLKIDSHEDELAKHYIESAKESLKLAGVKEQEGALYKNAVLIQVLLDYENHDVGMSVESMKKALHSIILKLKYFGGEDE